jgi:hypothetical protein
MKKQYFLFFFWTCTSYIQAQYTAISDANFEQALIDLVIDSDGTINGQVLTSNISTITTLLVYDRGISNFQGIQDFTSLVALNINDNNNFMMQQFFLDLSANTQLKELYCSKNFMFTLDVSNNPLLEILYCDGNVLSALDITNNINLKELNCSFNALSSINLSQNNNLEKLYIISNNINNINVSNITNLKRLTLHDNNLSSINISNNPLLEGLGIIQNHITTIDVSQNSMLKILGCENNLLSNLNLSNNHLLEILNCKSNNLLNTIYLQNDNNTLLNGVYDLGTSIPTFRNRFSATGCPNLHCIFVDDVANSNTNWLGKDATSTYVSSQAQCDAVVLGNSTFESPNVVVFPNPTNDVVTINFGGFQDKVTVTLLNVLGQMVASKTFNQLDTTTYPITGDKGLYFLEITNQNGEKKIIKVVKE